MDSLSDPWLRAQQCLTVALQALDESGAPADIGAHVEHAISRLSEILETVDQPLR